MEQLVETPEEKVFFENRGSVPEPKPEPKPEPVAEAPKAAEPAPVAEQPKPAEQKTVPLAALMEERRQFQEKLDRAMGRFEQLQAMLQPKQEPQEPLPIEKRVEQIESHAQQQAFLEQLRGFGSRHAAEFAKQTPDFFDGYNHLRTSRANQLMESGQVRSAEELNMRIQQEEAGILQLCAQMNVDPAAFMYNLARSAGYQVVAPTTPPAETNNAIREAAATPRDPETGKFVPKAPTAEEKIKIQAEGMSRAENPVNKAGAGVPGPIDVKAIMNMDDDEFDKATQGKNWKKLMGG